MARNLSELFQLTRILVESYKPEDMEKAFSLYGDLSLWLNKLDTEDPSFEKVDLLIGDLVQCIYSEQPVRCSVPISPPAPAPPSVSVPTPSVLWPTSPLVSHSPQSPVLSRRGSVSLLQKEKLPSKILKVTIREEGGAKYYTFIDDLRETYRYENLTPGALMNIFVKSGDTTSCAAGKIRTIFGANNSPLIFSLSISYMDFEGIDKQCVQFPPRPHSPPVPPLPPLVSPPSLS